MITYKTLENGSISGKGRSSIPPTHGWYRIALEEVETGDAEILPYIASSISWEELNASRVQALAVIDGKSIRALREGDTTRINQLEVEAQDIRDSFETP